MRLIFTLHAKERMDHYGITEEEVRKAIKIGAKTPQTDGLLSIFTYLRVAYKVRGDDYIIKTVMIER